LSSCYASPARRSSGLCAPSAARVRRGTERMKTLLLFLATALAEIVGCYLPYLWLRKGGSAWLLLPAAIALAAFVWLLTLHPTASDRKSTRLNSSHVKI